MVHLELAVAQEHQELTVHREQVEQMDLQGLAEVQVLQV